MPLIEARFINDVHWLSQRQQKLAASFVHVHRLILSTNKPMILFASSILAEDELERAQNYRHIYDTERFILTRAALRCLLSQYTGISPHSIRLVKDAEGKLYAADLDVRFNIAHAGDVALLAFSYDDVGVDVEQLDGVSDFQIVMDSCFNKAEKNYVNGSIEPSKQFYKLWTRKEAIVKATGRGIVDEIIDVPVLDGIMQADSKAIASERNWWVGSFSAGADYVGSIAYPRPDAELCFIDYTLEPLSA